MCASSALFTSLSLFWIPFQEAVNHLPTKNVSQAVSRLRRAVEHEIIIEFAGDGMRSMALRRRTKGAGHDLFPDGNDWPHKLKGLNDYCVVEQTKSESNKLDVVEVELSWVELS